MTYNRTLLVFVNSLLLLTGEANAQSCGPIYLTNQDQIDNFQIDHPGCTQIIGDLNIQGGEGITNLNGLSQITSVGGWLNIQGCKSLTSLTGLNNLNSIDGGLVIHLNEALISLSGLNSLNSIGGGLIVAYCPSLVNLSGLNSLTSIGGYLVIGVNASLSTLSALNSLTSVGWFITISNNPALISLSGLNSLTSIGGDLAIIDNDLLNSLSGLDNINYSTITNLVISTSSSLSTCNVKSICDYLSNPSNSYLTYIYENASGCTSRIEVEQACNPSCVPPTIQATEISFEPISLNGNQMTVKWKNGNGNKRIVVAKVNSPSQGCPRTDMYIQVY